VEDYFAIAEVHAQSFYPTANWFFGPLLRLDRVQALQVSAGPVHAGYLACIHLHNCICLAVRNLGGLSCWRMHAQFGVDGEVKAQRGQFLCLVAHRLGAAQAEPAAEQHGMPGAAVPPFFKLLLSEPLRVWLLSVTRHSLLYACGVTSASKLCCMSHPGGL
jgi:hypothetical protein